VSGAVAFCEPPKKAKRSFLTPCVKIRDALPDGHLAVGCRHGTHRLSVLLGNDAFPGQSLSPLKPGFSLPCRGQWPSTRSDRDHRITPLEHREVEGPAALHTRAAAPSGEKPMAFSRRHRVRSTSSSPHDALPKMNIHRQRCLLTKHRLDASGMVVPI
jgi:hypothetical protein